MKSLLPALLGLSIIFCVFNCGPAVQAKSSLYHAGSAGESFAAPQKPYVLYGYVLNQTGAPADGSTVVITNENNSKSVTLATNSSGEYKFDLANMAGVYHAGDSINITANSTSFIGWNDTFVTGNGSEQVDIRMSHEMFLPFLLKGYAKYSTGDAVPSCNMTITNKKTSMFHLMDADSGGYYEYDISTMPGGYHKGETLNITANDTRHYAYAEDAISGPGAMWLNVTYIYAFSITLDHIAISPSTATVLKGGSQPFSAKAFDQKGNDMTPMVYFSWSTTGGIGALDNSTGLSTTLTASSSPATGTVVLDGLYDTVSKQATSDVTVTEVILNFHHVSIAPSSASVLTSSLRVFNATAYDDKGSVIPSGVSFGWSVTGGIGSVSPSSGNTTTFTASSSPGTGNVVVTATYAGTTKTAESSVTVTDILPYLDHITLAPASATVNTTKTAQFTVKAYDQNNNELSGATFTWAVLGGIGVANPATGSATNFTARSSAGTGSVKVTAEYNSVILEKSAPVTVVSNGGGDGNGTNQNNTGGKILGIDSWMFFGLLGGIIALALIAAILVAAAGKRKKKEEHPPQFMMYRQTHQFQQYMRSHELYQNPPQQPPQYSQMPQDMQNQPPQNPQYPPAQPQNQQTTPYPPPPPTEYEQPLSQ